MSDRLVTLASFGSPAEARIAVSQLDAAGIPAHLDGEVSGDALSYFGSALGGVKLQVAEEDVLRAQGVLDQIQEGPVDRSPWTCPACGTTVEHGFDVCWSCGAGREDAPTERPPPQEPEEEQKPCPMCGAMIAASRLACERCGEYVPSSGGREFAPARGAPDEYPSSPARDALTRAWRAAILGLGLCPGVLHFYSLIVLLEYYRLKASDGSDDNWRATATLVVDGLVISVVAAIWFGLGGFPFLG